MQASPATDRKTSAQEKARLRQFLKQKRGELPQQLRPEYDRTIRERLLEQAAPAGTVFCYVSTDMEVDTRGIIDCLRQSGITVLIPRILNREKMIAAGFDGWNTLRAGQLGILTPDSDEEWPGEADLCITPGLGFTPDGRRIGYGRGYYDKWFAAHPRSARVALCYECQIVDDMPVTDTDMRVHKIITEKRVIRCQGPGTKLTGSE
ncbi:MAG: 5-formyltetrahydrofolate cyclo-ligase [Gammaproteobacteria bacterium]|nr:5-formyltetrahydrofolate cyclo-ligase [Gammaproteobacteria bacterium]